MSRLPRLSLAAVPYFWTRETYLDFYRRVAESAIDIVYLGETVCSKRRALRFEDWIELAELLSASGKEVVLSTLTLIEAESELKYLRRILQHGEGLVEANDLAAVEVAHGLGRPFVAGSPVNIYNPRSLSLLQRQGMRRWCVPVELGRDDLGPLIDTARELGVEVEYQVFGRMPLAWSARCFTARHHGLPKDDCRLVCQQHEQGLAVRSQEGEDFAQLNGIQTQSGRVLDLLSQWPSLVESGISVLRLMPLDAEDSLRVIEQTAQAMAAGSTPVLSLSRDYPRCDGYWSGAEGMRRTVEPA